MPAAGPTVGGVEDVGGQRAHQQRSCQPQQRDLAQVVDGLGPLGGVVVPQPPVELGQDLLGVAPGRPDQEDPVEPLLVRRVAGRQPRGGVPGARVDAGLLRCDWAPPRSPIRGCPASAWSSSSSVSVRAAASAGAEQRLLVGVGLTGEHVVGPPRHRQAAEQHARGWSRRSG